MDDPDPAASAPRFSRREDARRDCNNEVRTSRYLSLRQPLTSGVPTFRYIAENTTIPIPRLFGYSINRDNILNLPYIAMEYITGKTLHETRMSELSDELRTHLFDQLAEIYIRLHRQQFDCVGALVLDSNDKNWVFEHNRLLTIELNDQELSGMKSSEIIPVTKLTVPPLTMRMLF